VYPDFLTTSHYFDQNNLHLNGERSKLCRGRTEDTFQFREVAVFMVIDKQYIIKGLEASV
jgi:hypothetical protein